MIFARSANVPRLSSYRGYRDRYLRPDFQFRCAYCLRHEFYFAGAEGGQIDHYRPRRLFPALLHEYANLYWTCPGCNRLKGDLWPLDTDYAAGLRFLDPCADDHDAHWKTRPDGILTPTTPTGYYTVGHLRLNRAALAQHRRFMAEKQGQIAEIERHLSQSDLAPETRNALWQGLNELRRFLEPPVF